MNRRLFGHGGDNSGAVAATVGLSLFALVAAGGIAFDYARLATLDTEMQNAADQAALAAATQLDQETGAVARATAAAQGLLANQTRMANDGNVSGASVAVPTVLFYATKAAAEAVNGTTCPTTGTVTADATARFVCVRTANRVANYALTPVVAAFSSGNVSAMAVAGLGAAICKVPPVMLCNPNESGDPSFTSANYVGKGIRLVANDGGGIYGPGNFGFLDTGYGNGAEALREVLGRVNPPGDCVSGDDVETKTGNMISVRDALNTRFDIYDNGLNTACGSNGGLCGPATNTRKDVVQKGPASACGFVQNGNGNGWREPDNDYPNLPIPVAPATSRALTDAEIATVAPMGYPRDICHSFGNNAVTGDCSPIVGGEGSRIGSGTWDRFAYFKSRSTGASPEYPEFTALTTADTASTNTFLNNTFGTTTPSRYKVYQWEMANAAARIKNNVNAGSGLSSHSQPVCTTPGIAPSSTQVDRRLLNVAVINCSAEGVGGHTTGINVTKWIEVFLVEPAIPRSRTVTRTDNADIYVEFVREVDAGAGQTAGQVVRRDVPYLVK